MMTEYIRRKAAQLDENTTVPLKIVIPVVVALIGATWAISLQISGVRGDLTRIKDRMGATWSVQNMEVWSAKLQRNNPQLDVPDASAGVLQVGSGVAPRVARSE